MGGERVYTILVTDRNPDIDDGVQLAKQLRLHPRNVGMIMGREAIDIFITSDKFQSVIGSAGLSEGEQILKQFTDRGYKIEERLRPC